MTSNILPKEVVINIKNYMLGQDYWKRKFKENFKYIHKFLETTRIISSKRIRRTCPKIDLVKYIRYRYPYTKIKEIETLPWVWDYMNQKEVSSDLQNKLVKIVIKFYDADCKCSNCDEKEKKKEEMYELADKLLEEAKQRETKIFQEFYPIAQNKMKKWRFLLGKCFTKTQFDDEVKNLCKIEFAIKEIEYLNEYYENNPICWDTLDNTEWRQRRYIRNERYERPKKYLEQLPIINRILLHYNIIMTEKEWKHREYRKWDAISSARFKAYREVDNPPERNGKMYEFKKWMGLAETPKQRAKRHLDDESYYKFSLISSIKDILF